MDVCVLLICIILVKYKDYVGNISDLWSSKLIFFTLFYLFSYLLIKWFPYLLLGCVLKLESLYSFIYLLSYLFMYLFMYLFIYLFIYYLFACFLWHFSACISHHSRRVLCWQWSARWWWMWREWSVPPEAQSPRSEAGSWTRAAGKRSGRAGSISTSWSSHAHQLAGRTPRCMASSALRLGCEAPQHTLLGPDLQKNLTIYRKIIVSLS